MNVGRGQRRVPSLESTLRAVGQNSQAGRPPAGAFPSSSTLSQVAKTIALRSLLQHRSYPFM